MRVFFYTGLWRLYLTKMSAFFCKKQLSRVWTREKKIILVKKIIFVARGGRFCDLLSFPKNKDRSPKIRITCIQSLFLFQSCDRNGHWKYVTVIKNMDRSLSPCDQHTKRGLPDIRIDPYFWKTGVGQLSRPFWGGGKWKKHPIFGFLASSHIPLIHFAKKMSQNGQLCPQ